MSIRQQQGFTLLEGVLAMGLMLLILSGVWMMFGSSSKQTAAGAEMQEKYHRLRIVTEMLKDDLREAFEITEPAEGQSGPLIRFQKFSSLLSEEITEIGTQLRLVEYKYDAGEQLLVGTYGPDKIPLVDTNLFADVRFEHLKVMGRTMIRMHFTLKKDTVDDGREIKIIHTVAPRAYSSVQSKPGWYSFSQTTPRPDE